MHLCYDIGGISADDLAFQHKDAIASRLVPAQNFWKSLLLTRNNANQSVYASLHELKMVDSEFRVFHKHLVVTA